MSPAPIQPRSTGSALSASFGDCEYGWMDFRLEADGRAAQIWLSEIFDPLPALIAWLEAIARGGPECRLEIDEESCVAVLLTSSPQGIDGAGPREVTLQIWEKYKPLEPPVFECRVSRFRLVQAIYTALHEYGQSDKFDPRHWSPHTLAERVPHLYGCPAEDWIEAHLADDHRQARLALWPLDPFWADQARFVAPLADRITPAERETLHRFGHSLDGGPCLFQCLEGWDRLDLADRRSALQAELAQEACGGFAAAPIHTLRSARIESWLEDQARHQGQPSSKAQP